MEPCRVVFCVEKPIGRACLEHALSLPNVRVEAVCARDIKQAWWGDDDFHGLCQTHGVDLVPRSDLLSRSYDILVSIGYPFRIDASILARATRSCLNLHLGPLPRWRGCNTGAHAILAGDTSYGVTLHQMEETLDSGPIIVREEFAISPDITGRELFELSERVGKEVFNSWFSRIVEGYDLSFDQDSEASCGTNARDSIDPYKQIPLELPLPEVYRRARALEFVPWDPPAFIYNGERFFVLIGDGPGRNRALVSSFKHCSLPTELCVLPLKTGQPLVIDGFIRPLCVISEIDYGRLNKLFA